MNQIAANSIAKKKARQPGQAAIDTSLLFTELRSRFQNNQRPVHVDFRHLVNWVKPGDRLTHFVHSYPAKLLPHIAHFFLRASVVRANAPAILDPFCGSGTVALEASLVGGIPYIADANPLALLIAGVKTTPYNTDTLAAQLRRILGAAKRIKHAPQIDIVNSHLWYTDKRKLELERLLRAIGGVEEESVRDFFRVAFSSTARRLSRADPAVSVPVRLRERPALGKATNSKIRSRLAKMHSTPTLEEFFRVCQANIQRVHTANQALPTRQSAVPVGTNARSLRLPGAPDKRLPSCSVHLTVTSPPYGSAQKYVRASSLSLNWLELASPDQLSTLEGQSIGREHVPNWQGRLSEQLPPPFEALLQRVESIDSRRAIITRTYLAELRTALQEISRVTAFGGRVIMIVGNNRVCGEALNNDQFVTAELLTLGFQLELHVTDEIRSRGLMTKRNTTASMISRESILVFRKCP